MSLTTTLPRPYVLRDNDQLLTNNDEPYVLRMRDLPLEEKPREKLMQLGPKNLDVAELVAILLGVGTRREDVMAMSRRILHEYGERAISHELDHAKLADALHIPIGKACQIVASFELGRRFYANRAGRSVHVRTVKQAYQYLRGMEGSKKEQLRGLYLNSRYEVIHDEVISVGSLTSSIVHPREVFQPAISHGAVALIIAHNHPSGNTQPTTADIDVTRQLVEAGKVLGIDVLDHLIIAENKFKSIMELV